MSDGSVKLGFHIIVPNPNIKKMIYGKHQRNIEFLKIKTSCLLAQLYKKQFTIWVQVKISKSFSEQTQLFEEGAGTQQVKNQLKILKGNPEFYDKIMSQRK